ncbi:hypothetical protein VI34_01095 [Methylophilales bacterium MBRSG12]|uniref:Uncharacterized protein n=1 Tax=Methylophilales bacterium MBRS-H7 TaxID=1623450 RepID=A0A0H4JA73_9PROT|nr:hypothetical protein UZ34_02025 [Methylophilales bacterium MBRSF5]AKO65397.1 hypothetical protein VI33_01095 [Methylophilales bacterium MBRS-H7]AKO66716.1 hypothetical protein VI34_01095 [Methylophilales bacterium MBRSG12]
MKKILFLTTLLFSISCFAQSSYTQYTQDRINQYKHLTDKIETLENVVRLKGLVSKAIENENYDLACKAQSKIYDLTMKAQIRDMIQVSKDQKETYCSVQKYSLLNN